MIDNSLVFSDKQAVTTTAASTNVVKTNGGDVPNRLFLVVRVDSAFAGAMIIEVLEISFAIIPLVPRRGRLARRGLVLR